MSQRGLAVHKHSAERCKRIKIAGPKPCYLLCFLLIILLYFLEIVFEP